MEVSRNSDRKCMHFVVVLSVVDVQVMCIGPHASGRIIVIGLSPRRWRFSLSSQLAATVGALGLPPRLPPSTALTGLSYCLRLLCVKSVWHSEWGAGASMAHFHARLVLVAKQALTCLLHQPPTWYWYGTEYRHAQLWCRTLDVTVL